MITLWDTVAQNVTLILTTSAITFFAFFALFAYLGDRQKKADELEEKMKRLAYYESQNKLNIKEKSATKQNHNNVNSGGYIVWNLPEKNKSMVNDLLKGFEEFAKLKGYSIVFSFNNSMLNKIAFKFTLRDSGKKVNEKEIRRDIQEYMDNLENGDYVDDLPEIISPIEHKMVSTALKNRLMFLHFNHKLEKNTREYLEKLIEESRFSPVVVNGDYSPKRVTLANSPGAAVGEHISDIDNSDYSSILISNSFNRKYEQLRKIDEIIDLFKKEAKVNSRERKILTENFKKIKSELSKEEKPNKSKIGGWLMNTKKVVESVVLSHEATQAVKWIYDSFNF
jgi:hypothetical protein